MFGGIEHIAVSARDPQALARWYVSNLDFAVQIDGGTSVFVKAPNGSYIEIITAAGALTVPAPKLNDPGMRHFAISVKDFDAAYARLKSAGVAFEGEPFRAGENRVVFFRDPEGNLLHLIFRPVPLP